MRDFDTIMKESDKELDRYLNKKAAKKEAAKDAIAIVACTACFSGAVYYMILLIRSI